MGSDLNWVGSGGVVWWEANQRASVIRQGTVDILVGGDVICQDLGVSPEWSDYRPQFTGPKVPSELAILNPGPRSGPAGEG